MRVRAPEREPGIQLNQGSSLRTVGTIETTVTHREDLLEGTKVWYVDDVFV